MIDDQRELWRLVARVDALERATETRHEENKESIDKLDNKLDTLLDAFSKAKGGWWVLSILGGLGMGALAVLGKLIGIKFGA